MKTFSDYLNLKEDFRRDFGDSALSGQYSSAGFEGMETITKAIGVVLNNPADKNTLLGWLARKAPEFKDELRHINKSAVGKITHHEEEPDVVSPNGSDVA